MIVILLVVLACALGVLALATWAGSAAIKSAHPPHGRFVTVDGVKLHIIEQGQTTGQADAPPVVLLHGASGNLEEMRMALGSRLDRYRAIYIDRPGQGWSDAPGVPDDKRLARQVALIHGVLEQFGVTRAVIVGHSLAGALVAAYALAYPQGVAGLVFVGAVTHRWPGGIAWYYSTFATPVLGPLFAYTAALPLGYLFTPPAVSAVFSPNMVPLDYVERSALNLALRPRAFIENARDVSALKDFVSAQSPRYSEIKAPTAIITGDRDGVVSPTIHSRSLAATLPQSTLVVLPDTGHMPHHTAPDRIITAINQVVAADKAALRR